MNPALPEHAVDAPPCAVRITLPDGSVRTFAQPVTGAELAAAIGPGPRQGGRGHGGEQRWG